jgi:hypothetical protein
MRIWTTLAVLAALLGGLTATTAGAYSNCTTTCYGGEYNRTCTTSCY